MICLRWVCVFTVLPLLSEDFVFQFNSALLCVALYLSHYLSFCLPPFICCLHLCPSHSTLLSGSPSHGMVLTLSSFVSKYWHSKCFSTLSLLCALYLVLSPSFAWVTFVFPPPATEPRKRNQGPLWCEWVPQSHALNELILPHTLSKTANGFPLCGLKWTTFRHYSVPLWWVTFAYTV